MAHETRQIGRFEVTAIVDADIPDEPITDAFPGIEPELLVEASSAFPDVYLEDWRWRLRIRAWLIRNRADIVLVDAGLGGTGSPAQEWTDATGTLVEILGELGTAPDDVQTVVFSHAHDDHVGGALTDSLDPLYANARYVIQRADVSWQRTVGGGTWGVLAFLQKARVLDEIDGDHILATGLSLRHLPGHTPGHQILIVEDADERMVLSADTWNHPLQIAIPDGASGSDDDPAGAAAARRRLLEDLDAHSRTIVAPSHFGEAFGEVRRAGETWSWSAV